MTLFKKSNKSREFASGFEPSDAVEDRCPFKDEALNQLYAAIRQLSEIDRGIILLYLEQQPYQKIAEIFDTTANNIGVRVKRIKLRLRSILDEQTD